MPKLSKTAANALAERIEHLLTRREKGAPRPGQNQPKHERNASIIRDVETARRIAGANNQYGVLADVGLRHGISRQRVHQIIKHAGREDLLRQNTEKQARYCAVSRDKTNARYRLAIALRVEFGCSWYQIAELLGLYTTLNVDGEPTQIVDTMRLVKGVKRYCKREGKNFKLLFLDESTLKGKPATKAWRAHVMSTGLLIEDFGLDRDSMNIPPNIMEKLNGDA